MKTYTNGCLSRLVAVAMLAAPAVSFAQSGGIDTSTAVAEIASAKVAVLAIGAAVFTVYVGIKLYKWVRRAL